MNDSVSVLIVDDSALMRNLIARMVESTPGMSVAERAMNGLFALAHALHRCGSQVVIFHIIQAARDQLAQVVRLGAARLRGQIIQPLLDSGIEPN